jgi:quercetin dioxygenase-like cupin family protein
MIWRAGVAYACCKRVRCQQGDELEATMDRRIAMLLATLPLVLLGVVLIGGDQVAQAQQQIQRKVLLQQDLNFPGLQMVTTLVEIPVGVREVRHTHPGVLGVYVLEGTITVEHEGRPPTTYKSGDSLHVDAGKVHLGINAGDVPVKLVATLVAEKGKPLNTPAP